MAYQSVEEIQRAFLFGKQFSLKIVRKMVLRKKNLGSR